MDGKPKLKRKKKLEIFSSVGSVLVGKNWNAEGNNSCVQVAKVLSHKKCSEVVRRFSVQEIMG